MTTDSTPAKVAPESRHADPVPAGVVAPADADDRARNRKARIIELLATDLRALPVVGALILLVIFFSVQSDVFLSSRNLSNLLVQTVVTGIIALGLVFVLLIGEIDLSVAAISGVCSVLMARLIIESGLNPWLGVILAIVVGGLISLLVGFWTTRFRVPSFIVTLGVGLMLNGLQLWLLPTSGRYSLQGNPVQDIAGTYLTGLWSWLALVIGLGALTFLRLNAVQRFRRAGIEVSQNRLLVIPVAVMAVLGAVLVLVLNANQGIPLPVVVFIALLGIGGYLLTETRFGTHLYAIGGNMEATSRTGVKVRQVKIIAFVIGGSLAALAGVIAASRILGVSVSSGGGIGGGALLLDAIAAAVIGGVSLFGGRGRASSALLGALIIGVLGNGLNLMGVDTDVQLFVTGALLVGAVTIERSLEQVTAARL